MFYQFFDKTAENFFVKQYGVDFSFPPHLHSFFELIVIRSGKMDVTVDSTVCSLNAGDAALIFPHQVHSLSSTHSGHMLFLIPPWLIKAYSVKTHGKVPENNIFFPDANLISRLEALNNASSEIDTKGVMYTVCAAFDRYAVYKDAENSQNDLISKIFAFVEENFARDCTLFDCAHKLGYDHAYVSRYFKRITGISYNSFVISHRLDNAAYLLRNTLLSVLEISIECGFGSQRSFNRNFMRFYHMTPKEYRNAGYLS